MREIEELKDRLAKKTKTIKRINYITSFFPTLIISGFVGELGMGFAAIIVLFLAIGGAEGLRYDYPPEKVMKLFAILGVLVFAFIYYLYNKIYSSIIRREKYKLILGLSTTEALGLISLIMPAVGKLDPITITYICVCIYKAKIAYDMLRIYRELKENVTDWQINIL